MHFWVCFITSCNLSFLNNWWSIMHIMIFYLARIHVECRLFPHCPVCSFFYIARICCSSLVECPLFPHCAVCLYFLSYSSAPTPGKRAKNKISATLLVMFWAGELLSKDNLVLEMFLDYVCVAYWGWKCYHLITKTLHFLTSNIDIGGSNLTSFS